MRLGDLDDLKVHISELLLVYSGEELANAILNAIDNAPTVEEDKIIQCHSMESKSYLDGFKKGYKQAIIDGKTNYSRPQGEWVEFADFVARNVVSEDFDEDVGFYAEVLCRKLVKLG